jgi:hypothetical protein
MKKKFVCDYCFTKVFDYTNDGMPLLKGYVCSKCNDYVVARRIFNLFHKK